VRAAAAGVPVLAHVALLRGINVGTGPRIAMTDLRDVAAELGWDGVRTHLQSGNVVFRVPRSGVRTTAELATALQQAVLARFGLDPAVVVLTAEELAAVAAGSPFQREAAAGPTTVHTVVLSVPAGPDLVARVAGAQTRFAGSGGDRAVAVGRAVHLLLPDGLGRSRLAATITRPGALGPGIVTTARNASTVAALLAMTALPPDTPEAAG